MFGREFVWGLFFFLSFFGGIEKCFGIYRTYLELKWLCDPTLLF